MKCLQLESKWPEFQNLLIVSIALSGKSLSLMTNVVYPGRSIWSSFDCSLQFHHEGLIAGTDLGIARP